MESRGPIEQLQRQLPLAMRADVAWCERKLAAARQRLRRGQSARSLLERVSERLERSVAQVRRRQASTPKPRFDDSLPIHAHREEIVAAIRAHPVVILAGETGSGKTTQLPKLCLEAGRGERGLIGCTQPRRIAARAMAERVAEELEVGLGDAVGFQVRFRQRIGPDSLVKFMTDGILLAETAQDRDLDAYDTLVIDEAHERSLNIDFLLGYLRQLLPRRPDLRVIITSATIDTGKFSKHFSDAPVIEVSGRGYPVDIVYQPLDGEGDSHEGDRRNLYRGVADAIERLSRTDPRGDVLVFLSGEREIREAMKYLDRRSWRHTEILPLYARLSGAEQRRVFHPGPQRRIILSTNVAETSLTVPRIRFVVDSGYARISRYAHRSRIQRLPIEPVSQASANQRAGRCGRLGPGTCVRLYEQDDFEQRPEFTEPEILRTSLASVILRMGVMGLGAVEDFPFVDAPAPRMISDAYQLLYELGAVDRDRAPTRLGRRLAAWPLDVRLARMVLEGGQQGCLEDVLVIAAGLSIQDPRERPLEAQAAADEAHGRFADPKSDFAALLKLWEYLRSARREHTGNQFRRRCRDEFLNWQRVLEWFDLYQQLRDQAREEGMPLKGGHGSYAQLHLALLSGLLGQVGQRDPEEPSYLGARGRRFHIFPGSHLFGRSPRWLVPAEIVETTRPWARMNAQVEAGWIEQLAGHLVKRQYLEPHWSDRRGEVMAFEQVSLFGLVLVERRRVRFGPVHPTQARGIFVREALVPGLLDAEVPELGPFLNLKKALEQTEHKRRVRDVLIDDESIATLFESRLPEPVNSTRALKEWLRKGGPRAREALNVARGDLLREDAPADDTALWPDAWPVADESEWPLEYRFLPGEPDDGVSLRVPLERLNQLDAGRAEWLVPGYLPEKVTALIKSLPKPQRRALAPAPEFARRTLAEIGTAPGGGLLGRLAAALSALSGVRIRASDFDEAALPEHLRLRVVVLDTRGETLASGRDIEALQARFGDRARRRFMDRQGEQWNRDGETGWTFGQLPERVETEAGVRAWPALVDQEQAVGLRLFDAPEDAALSHAAGVTRLLGLALADRLRYARRHHGLSREACLAWAPLGSVEDLVRDLAWSSLVTAADAGPATVRDAEAFASLAARVRNALGPEFQRRSGLLNGMLESAGSIAVALDEALAQRRPEACADLRSQLDDLLYDGFLLDLAAGRLRHYPRYLQAMELRLERLEIDPSRDAQRMEEIGPWWRRYTERIAAGEVYDEALDRYRWLLEEYRVSLFAQQLGTDGKVSPQRLEEAWGKVVG